MNFYLTSNASTFPCFQIKCFLVYIRNNTERGGGGAQKKCIVAYKRGGIKIFPKLYARTEWMTSYSYSEKKWRQ